MKPLVQSRVLPLLQRWGVLVFTLIGTVALWAAAVTNAPPDKGGKAVPAKPAEPAATNKVWVEVVIPKSSFEFKVGVSKDPFYPTSTRLNPAPPPVVKTNVTVQVDANLTNAVPSTTSTTPPPVPVVKAKPSACLSLKGLFLGRTKSATINTTVKTYDILLGEEMLVRTPEGALRVKCLQVKDHAVILKVEGEDETVELRLRQGN